jgi:hypothetical protein
MQHDDRVIYNFSYADRSTPHVPGYPLETQLNKTSVFESCESWDVILKDFIGFLEGIYGYNISDEVTMTTLEERCARTRYFTDDPDGDPEGEGEDGKEDWK